MKRAAAWLLSGVLAAGILTGCGNFGQQAGSAGTEGKTAEAGTKAAGTDQTEEVGAGINKEGFPIVNDKITMTVYGCRDQNHAPWNEVLVLNKYEEMTNIHMDYQEVPADGFEENKQLLFASNDLPDIFLKSDIKIDQIATYGVGSGQLMPLDDLIAEYAPNLSKIYEENPHIKQAVTASDGHMYTIPAIDLSATGSMGFKQWINKAWLDKLGKEIPTNIEEFKDVLIAFRDGDPNGNGIADEIPLGIREPDSVYPLAGSFGLQFQMKDTYNIDENGTVHNWLCDDAFKEYLMYLNDLYEEGLLWQDYYKNDRAAWRSNLAGEMFGAMYMPYSDVFLNCEQDYVGYEPLVGPHGDQMWTDATGSISMLGSFALSNTCSDPEAAIRWVDYFYSDEGEMFFRYGVEGETFDYDDSHTPQFKDEIINSPDGFMTALGKVNLVPGGGFPCRITDNTDNVVASERTKEAAAILVEYMPKNFYAKPTVSMEDMDRLNAIEQDIVNYKKEAVAKFVIGEWGFDKWEEYCSTLEQIGIRELEEIYQRALDASK